MVVFVLIGLVPVLGFFAWLLAWFVGIGAIVVQAGRSLSTAPA
jgi:hypothetical protein